MECDPQNEHAMLVVKYVRPARGGALRRDDARNLLRRTLQYHVVSGRLSLYGWAFLPSKVALLIAMPTPAPLSETLGNVFGYFTRRLNNRYHRTGAVFRTRFVKRVLTGPEEIEAALAKVHRLPDELALRPGGEEWSSASIYRAGVDDAITRRYLAPVPLDQQPYGI